MNGSEPAAPAVPFRDDFVKLYTYLRSQTRLGREVFTRSELAAQLSEDGSNGDIAYVKSRIVLDILAEMEVLTTEEPTGGRASGAIRVKLSFMKNKINLDKSEIYRSLKARA